MTNIIKLDFRGDAQFFDERGWFNATKASDKHGKKPVDWLRLPEAAEYISALADAKGNCGFLPQFNEISELDTSKASARAKLLRLVKRTGLVRTKSGGAEAGGGTWLHPKLAVVFARWLDVRFAVWCDAQIDNIIRQTAPRTLTVYERIMEIQAELKKTSELATVGSHWMKDQKMAKRRLLPVLTALEDLLQLKLPLAS